MSDWGGECLKRSPTNWNGADPEIRAKYNYDPKKAAEGTIRKDLATDIEKNTVHGSDSVENARVEVSYFFPEVEIHSYAWKDKR